MRSARGRQLAVCFLAFGHTTQVGTAALLETRLSFKRCQKSSDLQFKGNGLQCHEILFQHERVNLYPVRVTGRGSRGKNFALLQQAEDTPASARAQQGQCCAQVLTMSQ